MAILVFYGLLLVVRESGLGARDLRVDAYQLQVPWGWFGEDGLCLLARDFPFGSGMIEVYVFPGEAADKFKRDTKFPQKPDQLGFRNAKLSPTAKFDIDGIPFERVYWSIDSDDIKAGFGGASRLIKGSYVPDKVVLTGFELQSIQPNDRKVVQIQGSADNLDELHRVEQIVIGGFKHKKTPA